MLFAQGRFSENSGIFYNIVLLLLSLTLGRVFQNFQLPNGYFDFPLWVLLWLFLLFLLEPLGVRYILNQSMNVVNNRENGVWLRFQKSKFFGFLLLMALIWRTYFRLVVLLFPLLQAIGWDMDYADWPRYWKFLWWFLGIWVLYREMRLLLYLYEPEEVLFPTWVGQLLRASVLVLTVLFMVQIGVLVPRELKGNTLSLAQIGQTLPFMGLFFVLFYIPVRWIEIISDIVQVRRWWQMILYWFTAFLVMLSGVTAGKIWNF